MPDSGRRSPNFAYVELREYLRRQIDEGVYRPGQQLPTEHELMALMRLSRHTVRSALEELRLEGLITRNPGRGTFVSTSPGTVPRARVVGGSASIFGVGLSGRVHLVQRPAEIQEPDETDRTAAEELDREPADLWRLQFVRTVGNSPLGLWTVWLPAELYELVAGSIEEIEGTPDGSVVGVIDREAGRHAHRAALVMTAEAASPDVARALDLDVGAPLFVVSRTYFQADGTPYEHVHVRYVPKHYAYRMDLLSGGLRSGGRGREPASTGGP
jgi:GntR family transcriptional regulator